MTTNKYLQSQCFLSLNGSEIPWKQLKQEYDKHKSGSNCYSFAMNDFYENGVRPHKSVPGALTSWAKKHPELHSYKHRQAIEQFQFHEKPGFGWTTCTEAVRRLLADGHATMFAHYLLNGKQLYRGETSLKRIQSQKPTHATPKRNSAKQMSQNAPSLQNISSALATKATKGWRKVLMVIQSGGRGESTDFHFYAQYSVPLREIYNIKREEELTNKTKRFVNPYMQLGVNAFLSNRELRNKYKYKKFDEISNLMVSHMTNDPSLHRALTNVKVHLEVIPDYCLFFIPDPYWLFDVDKNLESALGTVTTRHVSMKHAFSGDTRALALLDEAARQISSGKRSMSKSRFLGLWAHKAGWATGAMNADGDGRLIFDPSLCNRNHGGYAYDTACAVVEVRKGYGMSSPPQANKM